MRRVRRGAAGEVSLERALSKLGAASRVEARTLILAGRVRVGGFVITNPASPVVPESAAIEIDGRAIRRPRFRLVLLHKPRGVVTTRRDPEGRPTVFSLLEVRDRDLVCVGRLDFATSGLLLFTSSTRFSDWLTDPVNALPRVYLVSVRGRWSGEKSSLVKGGVASEDGVLRLAEVVARKVSGRESHLVVTLTEGRNREVRRLMSAAGHEVTKLKRVAFAGLELGELAVGAWREVGVEEARRAFGPKAPLG